MRIIPGAPYGSFVSTWYNPIRDSIYTLDVTTDMTRTYVSVCDSATDVQFHLSTSSSMGAGVLGIYNCLATVTSANRCGAARIRLNTDLLDTFSRRMKTSCHEVGHSVGLTHTSAYGGCMVSGYSNNNTYSSHHVNHINSKY